MFTFYLCKKINPMKLKVLYLIALPFLSLTFISWGTIGHRCIGKIAQNHLSATAKIEVTKIFGAHLPLACTFADELRPYKQFNYTNKWHYINMPEGLNYKDFVAFLVTNKGPNVYNAVLNQIKILKNPNQTKQAKTFALKFLIHLVGDLHQPMHVSRAIDKGGNDIEVRFLNKKNNLHSVWDTGMVEYYGLSYTEMATDFDDASPEDIEKWQKDSIEKWIYESYKISEQLYAEVETNNNLDYDYFPSHAPIIKKRILQGGIRLAGLLNELYKK
ncbi:MAG: S1/P1 Nuclease [Sphingobacteriales bacterium]|nr:MAG: S1/P1 Nuclease [Sphingobacteriales bacterium]TAF82713.1 MAG: S1/P1 Nuclease [Sphingobacteriales bacterium]